MGFIVSTYTEDVIFENKRKEDEELWLLLSDDLVICLYL